MPGEKHLLGYPFAGSANRVVGSNGISASGAGGPEARGGLAERADHVSALSLRVTHRSTSAGVGETGWKYLGSFKVSMNATQPLVRMPRTSGAEDHGRCSLRSADSSGQARTGSGCKGYNTVSLAEDTGIKAAVVNNEGIVYPVSWNITRGGVS